MLRLLVFCTLIVPTFSFAELPIACPNGPKKPCIVKPALQKIFDLTEIKHDGTLSSIVKQTQKSWLRPKNLERWQTPDIWVERQVNLWPLFKELNLLDEIAPENKQFQYGVVLGATVQRMRDRIGYLIRNWKKGVRFNEIVVLVGERPLDPSIETVDVIFKNTKKRKEIPATEAEAARELMYQAEIPKKMRVLPIRYVVTPMKTDEKNQPIRPNTADSAVTWMKEQPQPGPVLAVSNQPYVMFQNTVLKGVLNDGFTLETIGPKATDEQSVANMLDNLARVLFAFEQLQTKKAS